MDQFDTAMRPRVGDRSGPSRSSSGRLRTSAMTAARGRAERIASDTAARFGSAEDRITFVWRVLLPVAPAPKTDLPSPLESKEANQ
jgi:hypothetical protein